MENNKIKARTAIIIKDSIQYTRREDLEKEGLGIVIIDIKIPQIHRIINLYRSFNPQNGMSPMDFFENQLQIIKDASTSTDGAQIILSGDLNLDESKRYANDYCGKIFFDKLNTLVDDLSII